MAVAIPAEKVSGRPSTRTRILGAAAELAEKVGAGNLSLEAVAERAGVSKGGLLYHFPNKLALLRTLIAEHVARMEAETLVASEPGDGQGQSLIHTVLDASCAREGENARTRASGMLAAIAQDPQLIDPVREHVRRLVERLRTDSRQPERALIAFLALEGLRAHDLLQIDVFEDAERRQLIDALHRFTEEDVAGEQPV